MPASASAPIPPLWPGPARLPRPGMKPPAGREGGRRRRRAAGAMAESNADWMGSLPAALRSYPLSNLAIPGRAGSGRGSAGAAAAGACPRRRGGPGAEGRRWPSVPPRRGGERGRGCGVRALAAGSAVAGGVCPGSGDRELA